MLREMEKTNNYLDKKKETGEC